MKRTCPRDRTPLEEQTMDGVKVDVCPKCSGAFFDAGEIAKVSGDKELGKYLSKVHGSATSPMVCPACGNLMDLDKIGDVEIDHCMSCHGVWLDPGEMDGLLERERASLDAQFASKAAAAEDRHYSAMPRGASGGRFAALGHAVRMATWKLRGKR